MPWVKLPGHQAIDINEFLSAQYESTFLSTIQSLIRQWVSGSQSFTLHSSGSTGMPRPISLKRNIIEHSARATIDYLKINHPNPTFLLVLNPQYTGGFMMLIRALIVEANLILIEPSTRWLHQYQQWLPVSVDLCALTPAQVEAFFETEPSPIRHFKNILLGGAPLPEKIVDKLSRASAKVFETFGMTETASHFALRQLGKDANFKVLPGYQIQVDEEGCLLVCGPATEGRWLQTNDVIKLHPDQSFEWLGRRDFVINSGGIKLHPETLEKTISQIFKINNINAEIALTALPDPMFGERLVLVLDKKQGTWPPKFLIELLKKELPAYHTPKLIVEVEEIPKTNNNKIDRTLLKQWIQQTTGLG